MFANGTYVSTRYRSGQGVLSVNCICMDSEDRYTTRTKRHREHGSAASKETRSVVKFSKLLDNIQTQRDCQNRKIYLTKKLIQNQISKHMDISYHL